MKTLPSQHQDPLAVDALAPGVDPQPQVLPARIDTAADKYAFILRAASLSGNGVDGVRRYFDDLIKRNTDVDQSRGHLATPQ